VERVFEELLTGLTDAQRDAVTTEASPLVILAGAGAGKTRVLTRRIAYRTSVGTADTDHVLALTFTRKAAGELSQRLRALGLRQAVAAGTFHAIAYAQLRRRWADRGERPPVLLDRKGRVIAPLVGSRNLSGGVQIADLAGEIEWAKARMISPERYEEQAELAERRPPIPASSMGALYGRYQSELKRRGLVDFDDLLLGCAVAIETDAEFAAVQRWRFRHLFVDEFQDVNPLQFRLLQAWLGDRLDLCVVGDPNQAIYSWNGADVGLLGGLPQRFPTAQVVRLEANHRCSPQVLKAATAVLGPAGRGLTSTRADAAVPTVTRFADDISEARGIAARLRRAHSAGHPWSHLAVLVRTNAQTVLFEEALRAATVPYRVAGGGAFLSQPEISSALGIVRRAGAGIPFAAHIADLEAMADEADAVDDRQANLQQLARLAHEFTKLDPSPSAEGFLAWLSATVRADAPDGAGDAVTLTTFHKAKGLEWPVVFVAGLEKGLVPIGRATSPEAEDEERRLLYVAITRAADEVHCSWSQRRSYGARSVSRSPSPWLAAIEAANKPNGGGVDWRSGIQTSRATLKLAPTADDVDPALLDTLRRWRAATAKAAKVPAYVVFHDSTLVALVQARPATSDELLTVPGVGPVKAGRYGEVLLALLTADRAASA
jgi:DNA helicase II / ATP-dependent DNA helicase PcrA